MAEPYGSDFSRVNSAVNVFNAIQPGRSGSQDDVGADLLVPKAYWAVTLSAQPDSLPTGTPLRRIRPIWRRGLQVYRTGRPEKRNLRPADGCAGDGAGNYRDNVAVRSGNRQRVYPFRRNSASANVTGELRYRDCRLPPDGECDV